MRRANLLSIPFSSLLLVFCMLYQNAQAQEPDPGHKIFLPVLTRSADLTWVWEESRHVKLSPIPNHSPLSVIDLLGRVHYVWDTMSYSTGRFIYHTYWTGSDWAPTVKVANTLGYSETLLPPVVGPDGRIHLLWDNELSYSGPMRLMYAAFDGQSWSPEEEVYRSSGYSNLSGQLRVDAQNRVHVLISTSEGYFYSARNPSGWAPLAAINPSDQITFVSWFQWLDRNGGARFYSYGYPSSSYFLYWFNGAFRGQAQPFAGTLWGRSTLLDGVDNLHTYWTADIPVPGGTVYGVRHQCLSPGLSWGPETVLSGQESIGNGVWTAESGAGRSIFAWMVYRSSEVSLVTLRGCGPAVLQKVPLGPPPVSSSWGELGSVTISGNQPAQICLLVEIPYYSSDFGVICAHSTH